MLRLTAVLLACSLVLTTGCVTEPVPVEEQLKLKVARTTGLKEVRLREGKHGTFTGQGFSDKGFYWEITAKPDAHYPKKFALSWTKGKITYHSYVTVE